MEFLHDYYQWLCGYDERVTHEFSLGWKDGMVDFIGLQILVNPHKILRIIGIPNEEVNWEHDVVNLQDVANIFLSKGEQLQVVL